jgi:predicted nucleic acid-binding protein
MAVWYLDTSAAFKLLLREQESPDLIAAIGAERPTLVSSHLLETELRRAANRIEVLGQRHVTNLLDRIGLYELTPAIHTQAGLLPGVNLRSLDALHLATAIGIGADALAAYDLRLIDAARDAGVVVIAPGAASR